MRNKVGKGTCSRKKWEKSQKENGGNEHISLHTSKSSSTIKEGYNNIIQMDYLIFLQKNIK